jgi:hypothetical protein
MFQLSDETQKALEKNIGMRISEIVEADASEQICIAESRTGKPLVFSTVHDPRRIGRGNPLLAKRRFKTITEVDKRIDSIGSSENG